MRTMIESVVPPLLLATALMLTTMGLPAREVPFSRELTAAGDWLARTVERYAPTLAAGAVGAHRRMLAMGNRGILGATADEGAIAQKRVQLGKLFVELEKGQKEMQALEAGKEFPKARGEELEQFAKEAEALQEEIDRYDRIAGLAAKSREIPNPTLPAEKEQAKANGTGVAGYVSLGDYVILSKSMEEFRATGYSRGSHALIEVSGVSLLGKNARITDRGDVLVPLSREQRKSIEDLISTKAAPTLGTGVLEPERIARIPQVTADDRLTLADVISTGTTSAGSIEYVREESHTQAAAETAHGAAKPEEAIEYSNQTAPVRTIAGWMPVQNQQLEDWPQLRTLIETRLRYSVQRRRERQIAWGNGAGSNIEGLLQVAGTTDIAANGRYDAGDHNLIDVVRMGVTDVMVAGYQPNFVAIHPFDWEAIILQKGTDNHYVWVIVTDSNGSRLWNLRVVETVAMQAAAGVATEARELIVGDGQMGAQILDRQQLTVMVGLINDQLIRNMRTILAEERLAFPIYAPAAFAHFETQASST
jgi:HK97 family phage major capsid protein